MDEDSCNNLKVVAFRLEYWDDMPVDKKPVDQAHLELHN